MPDMVVHFCLVVLVPAFQRSTLWQYSITRLTELRVDSRQGGCRGARLRSTDLGCSLFLGLCVSQGIQYPVDVLETLCFAGATSEVVGGSTVKPGEVRNE
jgi:hypothetical protein